MTDKITVHTLLTEIQTKLKAPKSRYNKFGEYHYRSLEDIMEAVKQHLPVGAAFCLSDELVYIGERYYVKATATLMYNGASMSTTAYAREDAERKKMHPEQLTGCSSSYARKYAANGLFAIDDTKDADADEAAPEKKGSIKPFDKTGNKVIDQAVMGSLTLIKNCTDPEGARTVGRYQWKLLKESGATEEQLGIIQDQVESHCDYLTARGQP